MPNDRPNKLTASTWIPIGAAFAILAPCAGVGVWLISTIGDLEHQVENLVKGQAAFSSQVARMEQSAKDRDRDVVHLHQMDAYIRLLRAENPDGPKFPDF